MSLCPPIKKRRTGRLHHGNEAEEAEAGVTREDIIALLNQNQFGFTQATLDAAWPNRDPDSETTWRDRIADCILEWIKIKDVAPSTHITQAEKLRRLFMYNRTHLSMKSGMLAVIIYKCVFGRKAILTRDTKTGGLLSGLSVMAQFTTVIRPMLLFVLKHYNVTNAKGGNLLTEYDVVKLNFGNWRKNVVERVTLHGTWSEAGVEAMFPDGMEDDPVDTFDETCCKGMYFHWHKWIAQIIPDIHKDMLAAKPKHLLTNTENTGTIWTNVKADGTYSFV